MKRGARSLPLALALGALCLGAARLPARADDVLPRAAGADRYAKMAERSPFAPPTPVAAVQAAAPPPPGPKWSDQLAITGLTQQGGNFFATVLDKSQNQRFLLQSNKEDMDRHLAVASVQWGDLPEQTTVTLRHNSEFAPVHFDAAAAAAGSTTSGAPVARPPNFAGVSRVPNIPPTPTGQAPRTFNNPGASQGGPNVVRRQTPIRASPTINAPAPNVARRPLSAPNDDDNDF